MNKSRLITEQCIATDKYNLLRDNENRLKYYLKKLYYKIKHSKNIKGGLNTQ